MNNIKLPVRVHESGYTSISTTAGSGDTINSGVYYYILTSDDRRIATALNRSIADAIVNFFNNKEE